MTLVRLLFRVLLTLLILLVVIGLFLPATAEVERSVLIQAPPGEVFPHVNGMRAFHAWSPWTDIDPETVYRFDGPEQGVGSRMFWESGDNRVGQGSQVIVTSVDKARVETRLEFGDEGGGEARFLLEPEGEATRVRWQFTTEFGWDLFGRYFGLMFDNMIGTSYEKGLATLKQTVEQPGGQQRTPASRETFEDT